MVLGGLVASFRMLFVVVVAKRESRLWNNGGCKRRTMSFLSCSTYDIHSLSWRWRGLFLIQKTMPRLVRIALLYSVWIGVRNCQQNSVSCLRPIKILSRWKRAHYKETITCVSRSFLCPNMLCFVFKSKTVFRVSLHDPEGAQRGMRHVVVKSVRKEVKIRESMIQHTGRRTRAGLESICNFYALSFCPIKRDCSELKEQKNEWEDSSKLNYVPHMYHT